MQVTVDDLKKIFSPLIPAEKLSKLDPGLPMVGQGVDSLLLTGLAVALENIYQVKISPEDSLTLKTLDDVVAFVNRAGAVGE